MSVLREDIIRVRLETSGAESLQTVDSSVEDLTRQAQEAAQSVQQIGASAAESAASAQGATGSMTQGAENLAQGANQAAEGLDNVSDSAREAQRSVEGVGDSTDSTRESTEGLGRTTMSPLQSALAGVRTTAQNAAKSGIERIKSGLKNLPKAALNGLIAGAKKLASAAKNAAVGLAKITGKAILGGITAMGAGFIGIAAKAVSAFGEMEQNIGGSETVFGGLGDKIASITANIQKIDPATGQLIRTTDSLETISSRAYATMGISQAEYLASVNKMGALFQGSGLDQQRSLDLSVQAMQRATDVASIMGIDQATALEAVTGAAKGNYTMMDNLGVAMNATTLAAYAQAQGITKSFDAMSGAEKAELSMQYFFEKTSQYAGNFEKEAASTVSGSIGLLKAAGSSLIAGIGDSSADVGKLTENVVDAFRAVVKNVKPVVQAVGKALPTVFAGLAEAAVEFLPMILDGINGAIMAIPMYLPQMMNVFLGILNSIVSIISQNIPVIVDTVVTVVPQIVSGIVAMLPMVGNAGMQLIVQLVGAIMPMVPGLITTGVQLILNLLQGIAAMVPWLMEAGTELISQILTGIAVSLPMIGKQGGQIIRDLLKGIIAALPDLAVALFNGLVAILENLPGLLIDVIKGLGGGILEGIKSWFSGDETAAEASQSGAEAAQSLAAGLAANSGSVEGAMQDLGVTASSSFALDTSTLQTTTGQIGTDFTAAMTNQQPVFDTAMLDTATQAGTAFSTGLTDQLPAITSGAGEITTGVQGAFDQINLNTPGVNAGQGFIDGLASKQGEIEAKAREIANSVSSTINTSLDIHSPSRVAMESARYFDLGLIEGLGSLKGKVQTAAQDVSGVMRGSVDPYRGAASSSGDVASAKLQSTENHYAPSFHMTLNGASASDTNKRKFMRWAKEAIKQSYESIGRTATVPVEV